MNTPITFIDLDTMIDTWAAKAKDEYVIFINQSEEMKNIFWEKEIHNDKLHLINTKMGILNYIEKQLEQDLTIAATVEEKLEKMITKLEKTVIPSDNMYPVDLNREAIYGLTENINCILNSTKDEVEALLKNTKTNNLKDPIDKIAKIMMNLLETLKYTEMKMEQMRNQMSWIHHESKRILGSKC